MEAGTRCSDARHVAFIKALCCGFMVCRSVISRKACVKHILFPLRSSVMHRLAAFTAASVQDSQRAP